MDEEVKVAILEQKQEVLEQFVQKLDSAIEKIAEVNTNVSKMLAVHEEKISKQEEIDGILLLKSTNSVIKWTGIMTSFVQDYQYWNGEFGLLSDHWEQL